MRQLTPSGQQAVNDVAQRHGFGTEAVQSMLESVLNGNGSMAQFSHYEFGGSGQWMSGGMTMIGDMFNNHLKGRVDSLCAELSRLIRGPIELFITAPAQPDWWGPDLRWPNSTGGQNDLRYAWFAQAHRLAIDAGGQVTVYDTLDHQIGGVSQQQSGGYSVTFTSQYGYVNLSLLPVVSVNGIAPTVTAPETAPPINNLNNYSNVSNNYEAYNPVQSTYSTGNTSDTDIFASIEKLAGLQARGILTADEFAAKKADLLGRL
jgi:Short C-terminal domain